MAGIKLELSGGVNVDGYISFTNDVFGNGGCFDFMEDYTSRELVELLKSNDRHDPANNKNVTYDSNMVMEPRHVRVRARYDDDRTLRGKRKFQIALPTDNPLASGGNLTYLDGYIDAIVALKAANQDAKARKFLLGVMLLTRCR